MTSPRGFLRTPSAEMADASWDGSRWVVAGAPVQAEFAEDDVARLRGLRGVHVHWSPGVVPHDVILRLAAAGVPLYSASVPGWLADATLRELITDSGWLTSEADSAGAPVVDLRREEHSVRLRRHALHGEVVGSGGLVSVVVASRRPRMAAFALAQIARQRDVDLEVVYAAHGFPADVVRQAAGGFPFPIEVVEVGGEIPFGDVLNEAVRRASGDYVAKWDDDDWYGPDHLSDLLLARAYAGADVVGTAAEFFYLEPLNVTVRRTDYTSEVVSPHVAGGTILLERAALLEVGGFQPLPRAVDERLLKDVEAAGGSIYRTHGLGYVLRRSTMEEHTWRLPLAHFLRVATNQWRGFRPSRILEAS
ncbi:glycosyltransferase family 2 protein [Planotetraspora sp. A-T 1434]|uniref:glycosyltransferase family 2 protein n=1 Tax=Planotetraspora sp. A-T 1434 TaxID=2979219 RepID=UPI0021C1FB27|nr:glycosyltransferase family 2 protein [Planotetraspora sp. A-T 1434]MCT9929057.1 glycosyltransferase family 2 protein [Planotetraspora sp. A-T 1434]